MVTPELIKTLSDIAGSEAFFALLFLLGLVLVGKYVIQTITDIKQENEERERQLLGLYKEQLKQSEQREQQLMSHLDRSSEQLTNVAETLKDIQENLEKLENKVESTFHEVWKELGSKANRSEIKQ